MLHPLTHHYPALNRLPQVRDVQPSFDPSTGREGVDIKVGRSQDAFLVDALISDEISGFPVRILQEKGGAKVAPFRPTTAHEIVQRYGDTIQAIPGVVGVISKDIDMCGILDVSEPTVIIETKDEGHRQVVDDLISDQLHNFRVDVTVNPKNN